ncbi:MAG: RDD family protein [Nocardioides sp.]
MTAEPVSPVPREARGYQGEVAGLVTRMVGAGIDAGVVGLVLLLAWLGLNGLKFMVDPRGFQFSGTSVLLTLTAAFVVLVVYLTAAWATTGRTWGSHVMGMRVVDRQGRRLRPAVALLRALFCAFFPIGLLWCGANRSRRSVQDIVLRTSVVYDWVPRRGVTQVHVPPTG